MILAIIAGTTVSSLFAAIVVGRFIAAGNGAHQVGDRDQVEQIQHESRTKRNR